jgi:tetratricopeptide (TPR) repeat protein
VVALGLLLSPRGAATPSAQSAAPITGAAQLSHIYDLILDARFGDAERALADCRGAPREACLVLDATRVWWAIQLDPHSRSRDVLFAQRVDDAIRASEAWAGREPRRAEAWFYTGAAYGARVQWRVLRLERLAAARDGKRIKEALDTALRLDPRLEDANFGIGLYQYYAAVAPTVAKFLRWLLLLPGGSTSEGLARMLRARDRGQLMRGEADYQIHVIYLWYEGKFSEALAIAQDLAARYPGNPLFVQTIGDVHDVYFHDPSSSARAYDRMLMLARQGRLNESRLAEMQARLGLAKQLDLLFESDRALEQARVVSAANPVAPYSAAALAWLLAGRAQARLGERAQAETSFAEALARTPADDPLGIRAAVRQARSARSDATAADVYRLALGGWRAYQRGDLAEADAALSRAAARRPVDTVTRYRYSRVLAARGDVAGARRELEAVAGAGATTPPFVFAEACVDLAVVVEASGEVARALELFDHAAKTFGADADTRARARREAARLRARREK